MKTFLKTYPEAFNFIVLSYWIFLTILCAFSGLSFGYGLGDLFYYAGVIGITIGHAIVTFTVYHNKKDSAMVCGIVGAIFFLLALYITYAFIFDRGPEGG